MIAINFILTGDAV